MASVAVGSRRAPRPAEPVVGVGGRRLPLEHSMLLTATLCLLAGGAVMVYSTSAPSTLTGGGGGTSELIRFVGYGLVGLFVMRITARIGLESVRRLTGPLLGVAFVLLVAVRMPGLGH